MGMDPRVSAMFAGPAPTARRIDGMRDARSGKPRLSTDRDYLAGYEAGNRYGSTGTSEGREPPRRGGPERR